MKGSGRLFRHPLVVSATTVSVAAVTVAGVMSAAVGAQAGHNRASGPGYPRPGGIYRTFTDCPLLNPLMQETPPASDPASGGTSVAACVAGNATSGSIKIGNITTPVVRRVNVQFGFFSPPNATLGGDNTLGSPSYVGGILPPPAGLSRMLVTKPDLIPESLLTALGCPSSNATVENLCQEAQQRGGRFLQIFALAQTAGQLTNFAITSWTQRVKFQLINPLLGKTCYIGSDNNPIVINPQLTIATGGHARIKNDPNPTAHPDTGVIDLTKASATDTTFTAPGVTGCGPGGLDNIAVDEAIDTSAGLPAASGTNSLTLTGAFGIAATSAGQDSALTQPQNNAQILLSAFAASVGTSAPSGRPQTGHRLSFPDLHRLGFNLHRLGLR